jgi:twinfilin-like protein
MSHQTGIQPNDELNKFMTKAKESSKYRIFKVSIKSEQLVLDGHEHSNGKLEQDFNQFVKRLVLDKQPCYLLIRLDTKNTVTKAYDWHLIVWSPELSPVREKMLYASTKATLKKEFGTSHLTLDYFATAQDDLSFEAYQTFVERKKKEENGDHDPELLTTQELDLKLIRKEEAELSSVNSKPTKTLPGVEFPLTPAAMSALQDLKDGVISYLQLNIHIKDEVIDLVKRENHKEFDVSDLPSKVPTDSPRYHLFLLPHNHEGLYYKSTIFVYSVIGSGCSVKERMLYSSCKNALMSVLKDKVGISLDKSIECDDPSELTMEYLLDQLHPKDHENGNKKVFEKPSGPSGKRGFRRLIK